MSSVSQRGSTLGLAMIGFPLVMVRTSAKSPPDHALARDPTDAFGADQLAIAPNSFVCGLYICKTQNKFARRFKIRPRTESHAAGRFIYDEAIASHSIWSGQDHGYLPNRVARRATLLVERRRDHSVTKTRWQSGCVFA
jgi:hypothetical protein